MKHSVRGNSGAPYLSKCRAEVAAVAIHGIQTLSRVAKSAIIFVLAFSLFSLETGKPSQAADPISIPTAERPDSLEALLVNVKQALESGLLLRYDFYREDILKQYFGGQKVRLSDDSSSLVSGFVWDFDRFVIPLSVNGKEVEGLSFSFLRAMGSENEVTATITIVVVTQAPVHFSTIEKLFGNHWTMSDDRIRSPHEKNYPPTAAHGNDVINYTVQQATFSWKIDFRFAADASLSAAFISTKGVP